MRYLLLSFVLAACASPRAPSTIAGFAHPESVARAGDRYFVSNIGAALAPSTKDGDGFVSELDSRGRIVALRAFAPLDAPKGMAVTGGVLYVADIDRVVGFDLATNERVFTAVAPTAAVNDLLVEDAGNLLVSDVVASTVYRLRIADGSFHVVTSEVPGANGIAIEGGTLYVAGIGPKLEGGDVWAVPLAGGAPRRLAVHGLLDGIAIEGGRLFVSDWCRFDGTGTIAVYDEAGAWQRTVALPAMHGPADFGLFDGRLWIPRTVDGVVTVVPL